MQKRDCPSLSDDNHVCILNRACESGSSNSYDRKQEKNRNKNKNNHPNIRRNTLCPRPYCNAPTDKERPHAVAEMKGCCNHADGVQHYIYRIGEDIVHLSTKLFMGQMSNRNLIPRVEYMPDHKNKRNDPRYSLHRECPVASVLKTAVVPIRLISYIQPINTVVKERKKVPKISKNRTSGSPFRKLTLLLNPSGPLSKAV